VYPIIVLAHKTTRTLKVALGQRPSGSPLDPSRSTGWGPWGWPYTHTPNNIRRHRRAIMAYTSARTDDYVTNRVDLASTTMWRAAGGNKDRGVTVSVSRRRLLLVLVAICASYLSCGSESAPADGPNPRWIMEDNGDWNSKIALTLASGCYALGHPDSTIVNTPKRVR